MTDIEIAQIFQRLRGAALINEPKDPQATIKLWRDKFGGDDQRVIGRAVGLHLDKSKFWPTPAEIEELKVRASWVLEIEDNQRRQALLPPTAPEIDIMERAETFCDYCGLCEIRDQSQCPFDF